MAEPPTRRRKRKEPAGENAVAARPDAQAKRYKPPEAFKQITGNLLITPEALEDDTTEVWLIQLPPQLDPATLNGVTWKLRTQAAEEELGHLRTPLGDSYSAVSEPSVLAKQLYVMLPSLGEGRRSVARGCTRHVSLVKQWPKSLAEAAQQGTPPVEAPKEDNRPTPGTEVPTVVSTKKKKKRRIEEVQ